jgi:alkylhydroperoxidase family enzyme
VTSIRTTASAAEITTEHRLPVPPELVSQPGRGEELRALFTAYAPRLGDAAEAMAQRTVIGTSLDTRLRELVRIRVARTVGCRTCMSGRWAVVDGRPLPESTLDKVDDYEHSDLDEREKVALRIADLYYSQPAAADAGLAAAARRHFTNQELVQMLLDLVRSSRAKLVATLRVDVHRPQVFEYDDDGRNVVIEELGDSPPRL